MIMELKYNITRWQNIDCLKIGEGLVNRISGVKQIQIILKLQICFNKGWLYFAILLILEY